MKEEAQKYHLEVLGMHNAELYSSLIYEHNLTSSNKKEIEFEEYPPIQGYFANKDRTKYFIEAEWVKKLPLKVHKSEELLYKEDVVRRPLNPKTFKILPENKIPIRQLVDNFLPFTHSSPLEWRLYKLIVLSSFIGRTYLCISTQPNFGKSCGYEVLHGITDKSPVFKPRSVPGVLNQITGNGILVFDDVLEAKKEVREVMEEMNLQIGGGKSIYINGAMKASKTKSKYVTSLQSITYLYNKTECYTNAETKYFEFIFENRKAIDDRFLKIKLEGELEEKFDREFDLKRVAEENKMHYIDLAKTLLHLQELKRSKGYTRRYKPKHIYTRVKGRKRTIFNEILWLIDMYSATQEEFDELHTCLGGAIEKYKSMMDALEGRVIVTEEVIE